MIHFYKQISLEVIFLNEAIDVTLCSLSGRSFRILGGKSKTLHRVQLKVHNTSALKALYMPKVIFVKVFYQELNLNLNLNPFYGHAVGNTFTSNLPYSGFKPFP